MFINTRLQVSFLNFRGKYIFLLASGCCKALKGEEAFGTEPVWILFTVCGTSQGRVGYLWALQSGRGWYTWRIQGKVEGNIGRRGCGSSALSGQPAGVRWTSVSASSGSPACTAQVARPGERWQGAAWPDPLTEASSIPPHALVSQACVRCSSFAPRPVSVR